MKKKWNLFSNQTISSSFCQRQHNLCFCTQFRQFIPLRSFLLTFHGASFMNYASVQRLHACRIPVISVFECVVFFLLLFFKSFPSLHTWLHCVSIRPSSKLKFAVRHWCTLISKGAGYCADEIKGRTENVRICKDVKKSIVGRKKTPQNIFHTNPLINPAVQHPAKPQWFMFLVMWRWLWNTMLKKMRLNNLL